MLMPVSQFGHGGELGKDDRTKYQDQRDIMTGSVSNVTSTFHTKMVKR